MKLLMNSPAKLREAIILNELLQPPLALRRWLPPLPGANAAKVGTVVRAWHAAIPPCRLRLSSRLPSRKRQQEKVLTSSALRGPCA